MLAAENSAPDGYIPLKTRLKAWWNGSSTTQIQVVPGPDDSNATPSDIIIDTPTSDAPQEVWPAERVALVEQLWGEAATRPGGAAYTIDILRPLNILPEMSVIDLAAGLSGETNAVSDEFGAWITGMESDPELAALAANRCCEKVTVTHYEPDNLELPAAKTDCIYAREHFCFLPDRLTALTTACKAFKPYGQLLITDFVAKSQHGGPALASWQERHPLAEPLWTPKSYREQLKHLAMDIRVFQDDSDQLKSLVLEGWSQFVNDLTRSQLTRSFVDTMVMEADRWLRTARALDSGELRYLRVHAMAKAKIV